MEHASVTNWRKAIENRNLDEVLSTIADEVLSTIADEVVMYPPNVNEPYRGKESVLTYLSAAFKIFLNSSFHYGAIMNDDNHATLEFSVVISGENVEGMEVIAWNQNGKIKQIKILLRPLNSVTKIHQAIAAKRRAQGKATKPKH